ncbi:hypothetical protein BC827DRAFT_1163703 [Russula dissimulans]|nr:hypothetical protein BC827DRAFT_1163703 [Russula dissimulans]
MPVPQGPRRAPPPRKKKQTPPAETESATSSSLDKDTPIYDGSDTVPEGQTAPAPVPDHEEAKVEVVDPTSEASLSEPAYEPLESTEQSPTVTALPVSDREAGPVPPRPVSPPVNVRPEHPDEPEMDTRPTQDLQSPDDAAEPAAPSIPPTSRISQEEVSKEVVVPERGGDETPGLVAEDEDEAEDETTRRQRIAERVAKTGGFNPFGGRPPLPPTPGEGPPVEGRASEEDIPVEGTAFDDHPATPAAPSNSYSVSHLGGGATAFDGEDDGNDGKY